MSDWNPDDPVLTAVKAPHETAGVMRWHRAHVPSKTIMQMLNLRGTKFIAMLEKAAQQEKGAATLGLAIHDALIEEGEQS